MFEKVNPAHPDKVADRIAGAIVDLAYTKEENPKVAVEVLIGHGLCTIIGEISAIITRKEVRKIVERITGKKFKIILRLVPQDKHLAKNQEDKIRCGDNGIFKGVPVTKEQRKLTDIAYGIYSKYKSDGKYILDGNRLIICQSNAKTEDLKKDYPNATINPLGDWTGGTDVDTGAVNRKLGSDMGDAVTGGGLCLSGETEYLGEDLKWHRIDQYKHGKVGQWNNGHLEFVEPIKYISNQNDCFIHFRNNTKLSMKITPYHQVLIKTSKGNLIKKSADEVARKIYSPSCNSGSLLHSFLYKNAVTNKYHDDDDLRLQIAFCADGSVLEKGVTWNGRIRVKKEHKKERLRHLLKNKVYKETKDKGYSVFWVNVPYASKSLYDCCKDQDLFVVYHEMFKWDGDEDRRMYRTTNKEDADFAQFVIHSQGRAAGITVDDRVGTKKNNGYIYKSVCYTVTEYKSNTTALRNSEKNEVKVEYCKGVENSYCFEVPSHNIVVRHDNKVYITGNCGKDISKADVTLNIYAHLKAQETGKVFKLCCAIGDDTVDGKPYSEIVEIARTYINKIGGFEKFSEWGLIRPNINN